MLLLGAPRVFGTREYFIEKFPKSFSETSAFEKITIYVGLLLRKFN